LSGICIQWCDCFFQTETTPLEAQQHQTFQIQKHKFLQHLLEHSEILICANHVCECQSFLAYKLVLGDKIHKLESHETKCQMYIISSHCNFICNTNWLINLIPLIAPDMNAYFKPMKSNLHIRGIIISTHYKQIMHLLHFFGVWTPEIYL